MFETSSVNRNKQKFHPLTFLISALLHLVAIGFVTFTTVWKVEMPTKTPQQISSFHRATSPPAPPKIRKGNPDADRRKEPKTETTEAKKEPVPKDVAPTEILDIGKTLDSALPETGEMSDDLYGHPDGDPNGDPDGVLDGVVDSDGDGTGVIDSQTYVPGNGVTAPIITRRVEPQFPPLLQRIGKSGSVVIQCVISKSGQLTDIQVIHASHPLFAESALQAVKQWRFLPGRLDGQPVATRFDFRVTFDVKR